MSQLAEAGHFAVWMKGMRAAVEAGCAHAPSLESAAQASVHAIFDGFTDSSILVRFFAILPAGELPADLRATAEKISPCTSTTPVITLLGSYGLETAWRDRRLSRGRAAIPLVHGAPVPMMANVFEELRGALKGYDSTGLKAYMEPGLFKSGCFHIPDANTALDSLGRKVIPSQDLVQEYGVVTVFGAGAAYLGTSLAGMMICFTRVSLEPEVGQAALTTLSQFRALTQKLVNDQTIFSAGT